MVASGSFGHFQASESRVHRGGLAQPLVKAGFVATRISVRCAAYSVLVFSLALEVDETLLFLHL